MKAHGPREERETIIRFDEESDTAEVWTASDTVYRRMLKRGWEANEDNERTAAFLVPKQLVRLPINRIRKKRTGQNRPFLRRNPAKERSLTIEDEVA